MLRFTYKYYKTTTTVNGIISQSLVARSTNPDSSTYTIRYDDSYQEEQSHTQYNFLYRFQSLHIVQIKSRENDVFRVECQGLPADQYQKTPLVTCMTM